MEYSRLNTIIKEEIDKFLNEDFMDERKKKNSKNKLKTNGDHTKKFLHKMKNGREELIDFQKYRKNNRIISDSDADVIRSRVDTEKTNMAAIARILFPYHTDEGAQSQFRKIINGERKMTYRVAIMIEKLIASGKIAVK